MSVNDEQEMAYADFEKALPKELLEKYDIVTELGSNEDCETLLLREKESGQKAVCKCFASENGTKKQDAPDVSTVSGTHFPDLLGRYENESYTCLLREYIEGESLDRWIGGKRLADDIILDTALQLALAMKELHDLTPPVIHRDIKPQNIIMDADSKLYLIDFGISRRYKKGATSDTRFSGTEDFAPPEQYGFMQTDARSDIYSFGIVLSWLLTGKASPIEKPLTRLERIAAKAAAFSPEKRFKNDDALIKALRRETRDSRFSLRRKRAAAVIAAAVCLVILAAVFIGHSGGRGAYSFKDKGIEAAVRKVLGKETGAITDEDLKKVTKLYAQGTGFYASSEDYYNLGGAWYALPVEDRVYGEITSIEDLAAMPNLTDICLGGQRITDISPLKGLDRIDRLSFRDNDISDLSPIEGKTTITILDFIGNRISDISVIDSLPRLSSLGIGSMKVFVDGAPVGRIKHINYLDIWTDTDAWKYLDGVYVETLSIGGSPNLTDTECMKNVKYCKTLNIRWSSIHDISSLSGREDIEKLDASACSLDDISPLYEMPSLKAVVLAPGMEEKLDALIAERGEPNFTVEYSY